MASKPARRSNDYPTKTLFSQDGITLTATVLTDRHDDPTIFTLYLSRQHEKNVINPTMITLLEQALDVMDSHDVCNTPNKCLIITGLDPNSQLSPKFFSNGLDLNYFLSASATSRPAMITNFNSLLARILTLPCTTIAAINGHCIGAGLFLSLACDYRIMRSDRGYVQWPEAKLGMRLTKGFAELSKAKLGTRVLREGILTAKLYSPPQALELGIVDAVVKVEELYETAFQMSVNGLPETMKLEYFDPKAFTEVKMEMYTDAYRALKFGKFDDAPSSRI
jgi:enoyl-CoA hydratase/carnithine racemase